MFAKLEENWILILVIAFLKSTEESFMYRWSAIFKHLVTFL